MKHFILILAYIAMSSIFYSLSAQSFSTTLDLEIVNSNQLTKDDDEHVVTFNLGPKDLINFVERQGKGSFYIRLKQGSLIQNIGPFQNTFKRRHENDDKLWKSIWLNPAPSSNLKNGSFLLINNDGISGVIKSPDVNMSINLDYERPLFNGQVCQIIRPHNTTSETSQYPDICEGFVEYVIQIDQSFVNRFTTSSNPTQAALDKAESDFAIASGSYWILEIAPNLFPSNVFTAPVEPVDNLYNSDEGDWADNIRSYWSSHYPCLAKDGIVYFSGRTGTGFAGYTKNEQGFICYEPSSESGQRVSIIMYNTDESRPRTVAHEIGHQLGLGHENEICGQTCGPTSFLMCQPSGTKKELSICMQGKLESNYPSSGNVERCNCFKKKLSVQTNCIRCKATPTSFSADNLTPTIGCVEKSNIIHFTSLVEGGCNPETLPIRARIKTSYFIPQIDNGTFSNYFTHTRVAGEWTELIARQDPNGPNNDISNPEILHAFDANSSPINVSFNIKFSPALNAIPSTGNIYIYVGDYFNSFSTLQNRQFILKPYFPLTVTPGQTIIDVIPTSSDHKNFHILGDLSFPFASNLPPNQSNTAYSVENISGFQGTPATSYTINGLNLIFNTGNAIVLNEDTKLIFTNGSMEGCTTMWEGINMGNFSELICKNSTLKDAQYMVNANKRNNIVLENNQFFDNNFGVKVQSSVSPPITISLMNNLFSTENSLLPPYSGQNPLPVNGQGYTGIYFNNINGTINTSVGLQNTFRNLQNGILAVNSNLSIRN
ncbi:MAG: hypothetical protein IT269_00795, partial [Saprospiraceae bacterium]|nr:hypothetical protein [Saprospiraceae bacterium]